MLKVDDLVVIRTEKLPPLLLRITTIANIGGRDIYLKVIIRLS